MSLAKRLNCEQLEAFELHDNAKYSSPDIFNVCNVLFVLSVMLIVGAVGNVANHRSKCA